MTNIAFAALRGLSIVALSALIAAFAAAAVTREQAVLVSLTSPALRSPAAASVPATTAPISTPLAI